MKARDVMTSDVASVRPDTPVPRIASILLARGISAVPVVDELGVPIGMVSEGDLVGRDEAKRQARWDWWLALLAGAADADAGSLAPAATRSAKDIMSAPVVTVSEEAEISDVVGLLLNYRIKRVPVVREGRLTGIISRADLLRALAKVQTSDSHSSRLGVVQSAIAAIDKRFLERQQGAKQAEAQPELANEQDLKVADFQHLTQDFERKEEKDVEDARRALVERRKQRVAELIDQHITDQNWRDLLHKAREAAEHGEKEFLLLRFPSGLCTDGSRAINVGEPTWPTTLRGEAAEIYLRWKKDLQPRGFHLFAQVLDFPDGLPGDVGLTLAWGDQT